jgi:hypothetical protein
MQIVTLNEPLTLIFLVTWIWTSTWTAIASGIASAIWNEIENENVSNVTVEEEIDTRFGFLDPLDYDRVGDPGDHHGWYCGDCSHCFSLVCFWLLARFSGSRSVWRHETPSLPKSKLTS